jgi:hypothetical protein
MASGVDILRPPNNHVLWAFMLCHDDNVCFGLDDESKAKMVEVFIGIYGFYKQKRASLVLKESNKGSFFLSFFLLGRLNEAFGD